MKHKNKHKKKTGETTTTNKKQSPNFMWAGIFLAVVVLALFVFFGGTKKSTVEGASLDTFAKCLTEKGAVMYGAFWCPHCARTKKRFGDSFEHIKYVECDPRGPNEESSLCILRGIEAYDTWEFEDKSRVIGEPSLEVLSKKTGCPLPS